MERDEVWNMRGQFAHGKHEAPTAGWDNGGRGEVLVIWLCNNFTMVAALISMRRKG